MSVEDVDRELRLLVIADRVPVARSESTDG